MDSVAFSKINPSKKLVREKQLEQCKAAMKKVWSFLEQYILFCNTHGAEFISHSQWDTYVPQEAQKCLLQMSLDELVELPLFHLKVAGNIHVTSKETPPINGNWLYTYVTQAYNCHLENLNILSQLSDVEAGDVDCYHSSKQDAMSAKKGHEVGIMSQMVYDIYSKTEVDMVVDVGSGKGYLGAELAIRHSIPVLGLDSNEINTHGAMRREEILGKQLKRSTKQKNYEDEKVFVIEAGSFGHLDVDNGSDKIKLQSAVSDKKDAKLEQLKLYVPVTVMVKPDMNLSEVIYSYAPQLVPLAVEENNQLRLLLTGLHTCGSLAVSLIRLFLQDPGALAVVNVGCCYQQMEEVDLKNEENSSGHFPLSAFGRSLNLYLGRNARNLAAQSVLRIQASKQLQGQEFYWRALLDVVIRKLGLPVPERIRGVRGLTRRCQTFQEYALEALRHLKVTEDQVPDGLLLMTEELHKDVKMKMAAFFQLKLVLAPVIESLVLLDRYMCLLEQEQVESCHLIKLFDPFTSPRCYALIARKKKQK